MQYAFARCCHSTQGLWSLTTYLNVQTWARTDTCHSLRRYSTRMSPSRSSRMPTSGVKLFPSSVGTSTSPLMDNGEQPHVDSINSSMSSPMEYKPWSEVWREDPDSSVDIRSPTIRSTREARCPTRVLEPDHAHGLGQILETNKAKSPEVVFWILAGWVLRHTARNLGYGVAPDGFVRISDVLRFPPFKHLDGEQFAKLIYEDPKDRFEIACLPDLVEGRLQDVWWVRARTMHSIPGVNSTNKRILNMGKLQNAVYRTYPENWNYIQKRGIPEGIHHIIRLHKEGGANLFADGIPDHKKYLCITVDCEIATKLGVTFYHTNDVRLYAVGVPNVGVIPLEACRSALLLDISKKRLK